MLDFSTRDQLKIENVVDLLINFSTGTFSSSDELREASSTFANYISGTIYLTFLIFLSFMLVSIMTHIIMGYARLVLLLCH